MYRTFQLLIYPFLVSKWILLLLTFRGVEFNDISFYPRISAPSQSYLSVLARHWSWMLQLAQCLECHQGHLARYHDYFIEMDHCDSYLRQQTVTLRNQLHQFRKMTCMDDGNRLTDQLQVCCCYSECIKFILICHHCFIHQC